MGHFPAWACGDCVKFGTPQCPFPLRKYTDTPIVNKCWQRPVQLCEGWGPDSEEATYGFQLATSEPDNHDECHNHCDRCGKCGVDELFTLVNSESIYQPERELVCSECLRIAQMAKLPPCPVCGARNFETWNESDTGYRTIICRQCNADMSDEDWDQEKQGDDMNGIQ